MAADDAIPPIPPAPKDASAVPPVEALPQVPAAPAPAPPANPYASPGSAPVNPYAAPGPYAAAGSQAAPGPYSQQARPDPYAPAPVQPYSGYTSGYAPTPPRGLSITSMVLGILSLLFSCVAFFGLLVGAGAVITGHLAARREPHARGMWLTGLITGYIGAGIALLWGVMFVAIGLTPLLVR